MLLIASCNKSFSLRLWHHFALMVSMKNFRPLFLTAVTGILFCSFSQLSSAALQGSIKIEQLSASTTGSWTLLSEDGTFISSNDEGIEKNNYTVAITRFGQTTLSVIPPHGMSAKIGVYRGGDLIASTESQQYSFPLVSNDNYRFVVQYALTKLGTLGVTSDPSETRFRMRGPSGRTYSGVSSKTFENLPAGRYTIMFAAAEGCDQAARKNVIVRADERNVVFVSQSCVQDEPDGIDRSRTSKRSLREKAEEREYNPRGSRK